MSRAHGNHDTKRFTLAEIAAVHAAKERRAESLQIDPAFRSLIPPLSPEEYAALEASLLEEGCRDALVVWNTILLDGHNRYELCQKHGLPFDTVSRSFESRAAAKVWILRNQLGRRNLAEPARIRLALELKPALAEMKEANRLANLKRGDQSPEDQNFGHREDQGRTNEILAKEAGVSDEKLRQVEHVFNHAPEPIREKYEREDMSANAAYKLTRALASTPETVQEVALAYGCEDAEKVGILKRLYDGRGRPDTNGTFDEIAASGGFHYGDDMEDWCDFFQAGIEDISRGLRSIARHHIRENGLARRAEKQSTPEGWNASDAWTLHAGDFFQTGKTLEDGSVDCLITDPPYGREHLHVYKGLGILAARVLREGGSLLCMTGQSYLPEVLAALTPHLAYHWTLAYMIYGGSPTVWPRNVNNFWKPVLWLVKGRYDGEMQSDLVRSAAAEKRFHEWQQSESGMAELVERFTLPGELILDPFCGSGTTGVVVVRMHRRFIGIDADEAALRVARERLAVL